MQRFHAGREGDLGRQWVGPLGAARVAPQWSVTLMSISMGTSWEA